MKTRKARLTAGVALVTGVAWLAMTAPAFPLVSSVSPPATLDVAEQATLQAKGARIVVPVEISCPSGADEAYGHITVSQRVAANAITTAEAEFGFVCDGTAHTVNVYLTPYTKAFKKGTAAAGVHMYAASYGDWWYGIDSWDVSLDDQAVITIK